MKKFLYIGFGVVVLGGSGALLGAMVAGPLGQILGLAGGGALGGYLGNTQAK